jgi:magnesium transporter
VTAALDAIVSAFLERHPRDAARSLEALGMTEAAAILSSVDRKTATDVLVEMAPTEAAQRLMAMDPAAGPAVLERLPVTQAVSILVPLAEVERDGLLRGVRADLATGIRERLRFPPDSAGRIMEPASNVLSADTPTERALRFMREHETSWVYLVDGEKRLVGVLSRHDAESGRPLGESVESRPISVSVMMSLDALRAHPGWQELDELPVVDAGGRLMGALRHKQLRRVRTPVEGPAQDRSAGIDALVSMGEAYCASLWEVIGPLTSVDHGSSDSDPGGGGRP